MDIGFGQQTSELLLKEGGRGENKLLCLCKMKLCPSKIISVDFRL